MPDQIPYLSIFATAKDGSKVELDTAFGATNTDARKVLVDMLAACRELWCKLGYRDFRIDTASDAACKPQLAGTRPQVVHSEEVNFHAPIEGWETVETRQTRRGAEVLLQVARADDDWYARAISDDWLSARKQEGPFATNRGALLKLDEWSRHLNPIRPSTQQEVSESLPERTDELEICVHTP